VPTTPKQGIKRSVLLRPAATATQPSLPRHPPRVTGPQGSPGGRRQTVRRQPPAAGDEMYLWLLVLAEVAIIGGFRKLFKRYHGG
jgi:hypothetical protein